MHSILDHPKNIRPESGEEKGVEDEKEGESELQKKKN